MKTNIWGFEPGCTSFCSWMCLNGGTRTFDHPEGVEPLKQGERDGNCHARFTACAFERALDRGKFPWAENPAPDGIYPSLWDMQEWKRILARKDVMIVPFDFCEHGHGPEDDPDARYRKRTWIVARACRRFARHIGRRCSGQHRHAALKGPQPGTNVSRCKAA